MKYTTILSIAGSDCSGGAGIQADIKTISALGCYAASIVTAVTVQNTCGVKNVYPVPAQIVKEQIQAISSMFRIGIPDSISASGRLGVTKVQWGIRRSRMTCNASGFTKE